MKSYESEMVNVLKAFNEAGALNDVIVSGSWAMYFYEFIFDNFVPRVETTDLDFYLPNPKRTTGDNISKKLSNYSYQRHNDYITGKTTFLSLESGFSIEFLTLPDRNMTPTINVKGLDVVAEALPKMAPAGWNFIQIKYSNMIVNVVSPVSFVLQKLLINKERKPESKKAKDIDAAKYVLGFIKTSKKYNDELNKSFNEYPKKWKKTIIDVANENDIVLF